MDWNRKKLRKFGEEKRRKEEKKQKKTENHAKEEIRMISKVRTKEERRKGNVR